MTYVLVSPETVGWVAADVENIGASLATSHAAAAGLTTGVASAAADEVSTAIAALFSQHAQGYQKLATQAAAFHDRFVRTLTSGGNLYAAAEAANVSPLQTVERDLLGVINAPTNLLLGRPLIGNGTNGAPGTGQAGGAGGFCSATAAPAGPA
jgi:hypothetical protein